MKAVMISINKPHTDNIFDGIKYNEWRTKPLPLCKHYVYETKNKGGCGKVIGEMEIVKNIEVDIASFETYNLFVDELVSSGCVSEDFLLNYAHEHDTFILYANIIDKAKRYDKPKEIGEFKVACNPKLCLSGCESVHLDNCFRCINQGNRRLTRPPQSWCYVEI